MLPRQVNECDNSVIGELPDSSATHRLEQTFRPMVIAITMRVAIVRRG
jgi:hypothetical protein